MTWWVVAIQSGDRLSWVAAENPLRKLAHRRLFARLRFSGAPRVVYFEPASASWAAKNRVEILSRLSPVEQKRRIGDYNPYDLDLSDDLRDAMEAAVLAGFTPFRPRGDDHGGGHDDQAGVPARPKPILTGGAATNPWPE